MKKNTGNGIKDNKDGTATIKCGVVKFTIRYEGKKASRKENRKISKPS